MTVEEMGLALVGVGDWGRNVLRVLSDRVQVPVVCHLGDPETAEWIATNYPAIDRVTDYGTVLADDRIDGVVLATPNETHARFAVRALDTDRHVFVEKPIAIDTAGATEVLDAANDSSGICFVGYLFCHHPLIRHVRSIHDVDPLEEIHATWLKTGSFGVDLARNLVSHHIAVAQLLVGSGTDGRVSRDGELPDVSVIDRSRSRSKSDRLSVRLEYEGSRFLTTVDRVSPPNYHVMQFRTRGGDLLAWEDERLSYLVDEGFRTIARRGREPLAVELETFLDCVRTGRAPLTNAAFGYRVARLLDAIDTDEPG